MEKIRLDEFTLLENINDSDFHVGYIKATKQPFRISNRNLFNSLPENFITTRHIKHDAITEEKIRNNAVSSDKLQTHSVTSSKIAPDSITTEHISTGQITGRHVAEDVIPANKLASYSVTEDKISTGAITGQKIVNRAVHGYHIAKGAVKAENIAPGSIEKSHLGFEIEAENTILQLNVRGNTNFLRRTTSSKEKVGYLHMIVYESSTRFPSSTIFPDPVHDSILNTDVIRMVSTVSDTNVFVSKTIPIIMSDQTDLEIFTPFPKYLESRAVRIVFYASRRSKMGASQPKTMDTVINFYGTSKELQRTISSADSRTGHYLYMWDLGIYDYATEEIGTRGVTHLNINFGG